MTGKNGPGSATVKHATKRKSGSKIGFSSMTGNGPRVSPKWGSGPIFLTKSIPKPTLDPLWRMLFELDLWVVLGKVFADTESHLRRLQFVIQVTNSQSRLINPSALQFGCGEKRFLCVTRSGLFLAKNSCKQKKKPLASKK